MSYGLVYNLKNSANNKPYVGQTVRSPHERWLQHISDSKKLLFPINRAIQKYGKDTFTLEILCECETQEELNEQELFWAQKLNSFVPNGYNLRAGVAKGSWSESTKRQISESMKGEKNHFFGKHHSQDVKDKTAKRNRERIVSPETKAKMSLNNKGENNPNFGKRWTRTEEQKRKLSTAHAKTYNFLSPEGEHVIITNLYEFCRQNIPKLNPSTMSAVHNGKRKSHKHWTKF